MSDATRLTPLFRESPVGTLILDRAGRIMDVNPAACQIVARPPERIRGTSLLDLIVPSDRSQSEAHLREVQDGSAAEWRSRFRRGDGLPRVQEIRAVPLGREGVVDGLLLFLREVDAVRGGRPETAQLMSFTENLPGQFVLCADRTGRIRYSCGLERTHFQDSDSILGTPYRELLGGERDGEKNLDELLDEVGKGRPWSGVQWHRRKAGGSFPVEVFASPHLDRKTGRVLGILLVGRDISVTHKWRDRAERAEPLAQIGSLSSGIAHRIADALSRLDGAVSKLTSEVEGCDEDVQVIHDEVAHFRRFLEAVAKFGNPGTLRRRQIPLPEILREALALVDPRIQGMGVLPELEIGPSVPAVYADRGYLARILEVLLENALDALEGTFRPFLRLEVSNGSDGVLLRMTNSCAPLPEEWLGEIFDPFFTTKEGRPGLGLAVAQGMVRAHDGRLWAEIPEPGHLRLSMELPREAPDRVKVFRPVPLDLSRPRTILLVDDDEIQRAALRGFLETIGYEVREAWSGRSAMAQVTSGRLPEIVVTDLSMQDGNGSWFLDQLRRVAPRLLARTVILSGDVDREATEELSGQTGCPVLRKPFEPPQFLEVLDRVATGA